MSAVSRKRLERRIADVKLAMLQAMKFAIRALPLTALGALVGAAWFWGGATRNNTGHWAVLELLALVCLGIAIAASRDTRGLKPGRFAFVTLATLVAWVLAQLVPLPWSWWSNSPGRDGLAAGLELFNVDKNARPLSLTPESSISALLKLIPPVCAFAIALLIPWRVLISSLGWSAVILGAAATLWGLAQAFGLSGHPYDWTSSSSAAGSFANVNHQATFLLMCLPLVALHAGQARQSWERGERQEDAGIIWASLGLVLVLGIAIAGSLFGYVLAPLVATGCVALFRSDRGGLGSRQAFAAIALTIATLGIGTSGAMLQGVGSTGFDAGERSRIGSFQITAKAAADFAPFGSGLGSFEKVYPLYEQSDEVARTYMNHAHNDYLELVLELGIPGGVLVLAFVGWILFRIGDAWFRASEFGSLKRLKLAVSLSLLVPLLHSLVDYPMRNAAVSCLAAVCLAALLARREQVTPQSAAASTQPSPAADPEP